jgi:tetratricopeptide (TPR) repeat protein
MDGNAADPRFRRLRPAAADKDRLRRAPQAEGFALWGYLVVYLAAFAAYLPAIHGGLLWDDDAHVTKASLWPLHGLWRIWFEVGATQQYYPVLHSAFWLEHRLWGDGTVGYHLVNVFLHATAACLFVAVLRRLAVPGALAAGLIFVLHPVCVESVAWISEQKNTLSAVFYLASALLYLRWRESPAGLPDGPGAAPARQLQGSGLWGLFRPYACGCFLLATGVFLLAILTKSATATLPAALLVVCWWKRGRLDLRGDLSPLFGWLALGVASGVFTAWVEWSYIGAHGVAFDLNGAERCLLAGRAIWFYLGKLLWPAPLVFIYPRWKVDAALWTWYLYPAAVLAVLGVFWRMSRKGRRGPLAASLYFCGTLFPALGFVNAYPFVFSYVADHFQYLASLGVIACVPSLAAGAALRAGAWRRVAGPGDGKALRVGAAGVLLGTLGTLTWRQCRVYGDVATLYSATLEQNPECWLAHLNLGNLLLQGGRTDEAIAHYNEALRYNPGYADTHFNLGKALLQAGRFDESIPQWEAVLRLTPGDSEAHDNYGVALGRVGRMVESVEQIETAVRLNPENGVAHYNLGATLWAVGRRDEARAELEAASRLGVRP